MQSSCRWGTLGRLRGRSHSGEIDWQRGVFDREQLTHIFWSPCAKLALLLALRLSRPGIVLFRSITFAPGRMASTAPATKEVPQGFVLHSENSSHILLDTNAAFLNPVQEFNRDLSVACIRTFGDETNRAKEAKWKEKQERKRRAALKETANVPGDDEAPGAKRVKGASLCYGSVDVTKWVQYILQTPPKRRPTPLRRRTLQTVPTSVEVILWNGTPVTNSQTQYQPYRFTILEALSATGLRSIRYAKEIPLLKYVERVPGFKRSSEITSRQICHRQ